MAKRKRAKKPAHVEEKPEEAGFIEKIKPYFEKYGFLAAFGGAVPLTSGWLLFNDKECGCFLLPKSTLEANNEFWGLVSIIAGLALVLPAVFQYDVIGKKKRKDWKIRYEYLFALILSLGVIQFYIGLETAPVVEAVDGDYDELTLKLAEAGWVMFYANWCEACHQQFDLLGTSAKNLRLVDCDTVTCPDIVKGYPTWARTNADGSLELKEGIQTIESLQQMAGLEVP
jgi:thiol-disulfide isomerase/thioredoxin